MKFDKLLVLDIDETLLHARKTPLAAKADFTWAFDAKNEYFVYKRPGVDAFLEKAFSRFEVGIWTSSGCDYAQAVMERLVGDTSQFAFIYTFKDCTQRTNTDSASPNFGTITYTKKLKKLKNKGYPLEKIIMVDNTPAKVQQNYGNAIIVPDFTGDPEDRVLSHLWPYLIHLDQFDNMRQIEKRHWLQPI